MIDEGAGSLSRSTTPAVVAMWLGYAAATLGFVLGFSASNATDALKPVAVWSVGALGVVSFARHALLHRSDAARMGWVSEGRNNFQIEVGMANLAWGLIAFAAVGWDWGVPAEAAVTLVFAIYLVQAFVLHGISVFDRSEARQGGAAWGPAMATLMLAGVLAYFAVAALHRAHVHPFH